MGKVPPVGKLIGLEVNLGLNLRDFFAGLILMGSIASGKELTDDCHEHCYWHADALLEARNATKATDDE